MRTVNIVGDVAGNFLTFQALLKRLPPADKLVLVGDVIDRGPRSKQMIEWCRTNDAIVLLGNHEQMMLEWMIRPKMNQTMLWLQNGGKATLANFFEGNDAEGFPIYGVDDEILQWLRNLPLYFETEDLFVTHAPVHAWKKDLTPPEPEEYDPEWIWSRYPPGRKEKFQVFGHNSHWGLKTFSDDAGDFAMCIDTSAEDILTAMHWPSRQLFQQPYIDGEAPSFAHALPVHPDSDVSS